MPTSPPWFYPTLILPGDEQDVYVRRLFNPDPPVEATYFDGAQAFVIVTATGNVNLPSWAAWRWRPRP